MPLKCLTQPWLPIGNGDASMGPMNGPGRWVLLAYQLPREPSTPRVSIWRKLRRLGVAQLMDGLVALPHSARNQERLEWLDAEIPAATSGPAIPPPPTSCLRHARP